MFSSEGRLFLDETAVKSVSFLGFKSEDMKYIILFVIGLFSTLAVAQEVYWDVEIASEVDKHIWEPFRTSYAAADAETFNSLHTDDIRRISRSGIQVGDVYRQANIKYFSRLNRDPRTIDFAFEHRIYTGDQGYEIGYYKIKYTPPGEEPRYSYARFHVALRKVDGVWKIAQDWDTDEINGVEITADDFDRLKG